MGLTQRPIYPGETFVYEFTLKQHGTFMYHSHGDEMVQIGLGTMGFFMVHSKEPPSPPIDKDYCLMLSEWFIKPGTKVPDTNVMTEVNYSPLRFG